MSQSWNHHVDWNAVLQAAHTLLARCLTELDGDEMDKVRGALVAEARAWMGEGMHERIT